MPATDKHAPTGVQVERQVERVLAERIPTGWSLRARRLESLGPYRVDRLAEVSSPAGESAVLAVEIKRTLEPREVSWAAEQLSVITADALPRAVPVVAAAYLSPRAPAMLRARGVGYLDITGNVLEREAIVTRVRGAVSAVDWQGAIRRWAEDYDQTDSNTPTTVLEARGLPAFEGKLRATAFAYAATGALAAQRFDPIAPARLAAVYVTDPIQAIGRLDLRETEAGANVMLLEPLDPVVFDRTVERDGLRCVAPAQLAVDLLTGPGREPSQGEEMLAWMEKNEHVWRS